MTYASVDAVIAASGIKAVDLDMSNDTQLRAFLEERLEEIDDIINHHRNRDYAAEVAAGKRAKVPPGIRRIALAMAVNFVQWIQATKQSPIINVDDFRVRQVEDHVLTEAINRDLANYPRKNAVMMSVASGLNATGGTGSKC